MANDIPASLDTASTVREAHTWASRFLASKGVMYPEQNVEWMLRHLLQWDSVQWLMRWHEPLPDGIRPAFLQWVSRRGEREPLQYILEEAEFFGRTFHVTPDVLIPRPETECLIEHVLDYIKTASIRAVAEKRPLRIVDVGVGSGAIAVTLALELKEMQKLLQMQKDRAFPFEIHAVDLSASALQIARENAEKLGANVVFHQGNGLQPLLEQNIACDIVVSNPPYIPDQDMTELQVEVRDFEPHLALKGGQDGMDPYRLLIQQCKQWRNQGTHDPECIAFEVGQGQAREIASMLASQLEMETKIYPDLAGVDRVVVGYRSFQ